MISIVIPVLNEASELDAFLRNLQQFRGPETEIVVVDGGSTDGTATAAQPFADRVIAAPAGRSRQMNAGAAVARGDTLLFLHADTLLPRNALTEVRRAFARERCQWGRFDIRIGSSRPILRLVSGLMNLRSRLTGIATGDQAVFVRRRAFEEVGGFPDIALMEDIAISKALKHLSRPACLTAKAVTSSRRWERGGILRTILLMWQLRMLFFFGANPDRLAERYGYKPYRQDARSRGGIR